MGAAGAGWLPPSTTMRTQPECAANGLMVGVTCESPPAPRPKAAICSRRRCRVARRWGDSCKVRGLGGCWRGMSGWLGWAGVPRGPGNGRCWLHAICPGAWPPTRGKLPTLGVVCWEVVDVPVALGPLAPCIAGSVTWPAVLAAASRSAEMPVLAAAAATKAATEATEAWDDDTSATGGSANLAAPDVRSMSMVA